MLLSRRTSLDSGERARMHLRSCAAAVTEVPRPWASEQRTEPLHLRRYDATVLKARPAAPVSEYTDGPSWEAYVHYIGWGKRCVSCLEPRSACSATRRNTHVSAA